MQGTTARRLAVGAAAGLALTGAAPSHASAASVAVPRCARDLQQFVIGKTIPAIGAGWRASTPAAVRLTWSGGDYAGSGDTNAAGQFVTRLFPPNQKRWERTWTLFAADTQNPAVRISRKVRVVKLGVSEPRNTKPTSTIHRTLHGFSNKITYASFAFGGRVRRTVRLGRPRGACGYLRHRMKALPARIRYGTWTVYYSYRRHFNRANARRRQYVLRYQFSVYKVFPYHAGAAAARPPVTLGRRPT